MQNPISLTVRLQNALVQPSLTIRCQEISQILQEVSSKDSGYILRTVIESIFGANENLNLHPSQIGGGWGIQIITVSEHRFEFEALRAFLSPRGPLLNLIYRLAHDPFLLLPFPISSLPTKVRTEIQEENVGAFYASKIQSSGPGKVPTNIMLNAFEFYMYHFGHFLVASCPSRSNFLYASARDSLYPTLLEDYLAAFLSCDSSIPPGPTSSPISPRGILSPVAQRAFHSPGNHVFGSPPQLHNLRTSELHIDPGLQQSLHCHTTTTEINVWTSHILVQVLMEIWINVCVPPPKLMSGHNTSTHNLSGLHSMSDVFLPSIEHVRAVRILIKHFHYFANSFKSNQTSPLDPLRRNILTMSRKSIYFFLKHLFTHWPLDSSFRLVLETWLSYIQPWRYVSYPPQDRTPVKSMIDIEGHRPIEARWKKFIAENLLFYSHLLSLMVKRALRLDLTSFKNAQILFRVAKVFSQDNFVSILRELESLFESTQLQKSYVGGIGAIHCSPKTDIDICDGSFSPQTLLQLVKSHIMEVEKQSFQYSPIFHRQPIKDTYKLLHMVKEAHDCLCNEIYEHTEGRKKVSQNKSGKLEFFKRVFQGIFEASPREDENSVEEMQRCVIHLDITYKHLSVIFNISEVDLSMLTLSMNEKNAFGNVTEFSDIGSSLTNYGRHQILTGFKRLDLKYDGDPELKPICSYEVAFLVRQLYNFTNFLNTKFESSIISLFYRRDFFGSIGRVLLNSPITIYEYEKSSIDDPPKRVAKDLPPRVGLRIMANKKVLGFVAFILFVFYLFDLSLPKMCQLVVPFLVAYVLCKATLQNFSSPTLNINRGMPLQ